MAEQQPVVWKEIRELAEKITGLYTNKEIVIGNANNSRETDPFARDYVTDSREDGYVNLMEDVTAPFLANNFGEKPLQSKKFYQRFDFGYDDSYEDYVVKGRMPMLYSQYLVHEDNTTPYTVSDLAADLDTTVQNVNLLIESRRDTIKKFWDKGKPYYDKLEHDTNGQVAAEIYLIVNNLREQECNGVMRFAYAGLNTNHNGNAKPGSFYDIRPMQWYDADVVNGEFVEGIADEFKDYTISLTGVGWENNLVPELKGIDGYVAPPVNCCAEYKWPILSTPGGGMSHDMFPTDCFTPNNVIGAWTIGDWCDKRKKYRKFLTEEEVKQAGSVTEKTAQGHFSAGSALFSSDSNSHTDAKKLYEEDIEGLDRWVETSSSYGNLRFRIKPVKFKIEEKSEDEKKPPVVKYACVSMIMSIVVEIDPKSIQPAIRKRWYDMLYYTLRNIAGYKFRDTYEGSIDKIIGVTWHKSAYFSLLDAFRKNTSDSPNCLCDRWKYLRIGNFEEDDDMGLLDNRKYHPFVGDKKTYEKLSTTSSSKAHNAAQMWQVKKFPEEVDFDEYFLEPYFEQYICAANMHARIKYYDPSGANKGGFKNEDPEEGTQPGICQACGDIILPWNGGNNNTSRTCKAILSENEFYNTHRFTYTALTRIYEFIDRNKRSENKQVSVNCLQKGSCYSLAKHGETKVKAKNLGIATCEGGTYSTIVKDVEFPWHSYYYTDSENDNITQIDYDSNSVDTTVAFRTGYNMYTWLEFDPGGTPRKDIEIAIFQDTSRGMFDCKMNYPRKSELIVSSADPTLANVPLVKGDHPYQLWAGATTGALAHETTWDWPIFHSEDTAEGHQLAIDIFIAPMNINGTIAGKYLGTYTITRSSSPDNDTVAPVDVDQPFCNVPFAELVKSNKLLKQKYTNEEIKTYEKTEGSSGLITITQSSEGRSTIFTRLKIPHTVFETGIGKDEHQKYIVLACRDHAYKLRSNLYNGDGTVQLPDNYYKSAQWWATWATLVGGCEMATENNPIRVPMSYSISYK